MSPKHLSMSPEAQRLAMAMAVVSQVHIANMNFAQARQEYAVAEDYLSVSKRLTETNARRPTGCQIR
jgi:hypothetical protein